MASQSNQNLYLKSNEGKEIKENGELNTFNILNLGMIDIKQ